jgi:hypothetical protein
VNTPNCEIIRGEVSIFLGGAGGLSYFSSGSLRGTLFVGAGWAEEVQTVRTEIRQMNKAVAEAIGDLIAD